jgi:hypothetical protein
MKGAMASVRPRYVPLPFQESPACSADFVDWKHKALGESRLALFIQNALTRSAMSFTRVRGWKEAVTEETSSHHDFPRRTNFVAHLVYWRQGDKCKKENH